MNSRMMRRRDTLTSVAQASKLCHKTAPNFATRCKQSHIFIFLISSLLFLLLNPSQPHVDHPTQRFVLASELNAQTNKSEASPKSAIDQPIQAYKLDCQPGEQRQFSYESSTKVWGSSNQQVRLTATLRLKCMEPPTNTTLKYLAEIVSLTPNFLADSQEEQQAETKRGAKLKERTQKVLRARQSMYLATNVNGHLYVDENGQPRAEPLFEEVGEAAIRMKRSVSSWFSKAWISVKDFFGNIFTSSERSSVSREQAFKETGLDIAAQCKAPTGGKGKGIQGLPFDESVFEDLGPEYYVGASSLGGATTAYEFSGGSELLLGPLDQLDDDDQPNGSALSFFDDPKPVVAHASRARRAATQQQTSSRKSKSASSGEDYNRLLKIPFVFLQSRSGKIIEVRFSGDESDLSVKNFKRHLCDLFATNLDANKTATNEVSPIGKHQTKYTLDSSANSIDALKESVIKSAENNSSSEAGKQLVRVLATIGTSNRQQNSPPANRKKSATGNQDDTQPELVVADDEHEHEEETSEVVEGSQRTAPNSAEISVLRSINTTSSVQLSSKMLASDIDRMEVRVKQVQQINEGRMIGTAGQLSMSLIQPQGGLTFTGSRNKRHAALDVESRTTTGTSEEQNIEDISELLRVSTSFSMQLVPISDNSNAAELSSDAVASARSLQRGKRASTDKSGKSSNDTASTISKKAKQQPRAIRRSANMVNMAPKDSQELQRVLREWRKQEARLQLSATNLMSETSDPSDSEQQRLDVLRDQIRQRLNEEFVRNRIRRSLSGHSSRQQEAPSAAERNSESLNKRPTGNDLGLGLTQLVLGNGVTARRKGSIYSTIEEVMDLEASLSDEHSDSAISRLMRDTVRMDKMREHCRATIPSLDSLCEAYKRPQAARMSIERTLPFGLKSESQDDEDSSADRGEKLARQQRAGRRMGAQKNQLEVKNDRKFEQCRNVLQLMLRLNDRQAINLAIELIDECNQRLLTAAKSEELGYGPVGKYYRNLRQQLVQILGRVARPSDSLIDKLLLRLYYPKLAGTSETQKPAHKSSTRRRDESAEQPEFVYVGSSSNSATAKESTTKYNRSLLKDEDDFNNNDGAGQLVMTLAALAAKPSVSRAKRVEVVEKLLQSLRGTSCSLFNAPDLDIIESMAQFQEPIDELAARVISLARRCRQHDQYQVACVHGLAGQLSQPSVQRFFVEQLNSPNASCTIKSEIMLSLIGAQMIQDFKAQQQTRNETNEWPSHGINRLDETLIELVESTDKQRLPDRKCLKQLVVHYFSRKHASGGGGGVGLGTSSLSSKPARNFSTRSGSSNTRARRAVMNENNFWDESHCKRWTIPTSIEATADLPNDLVSVLGARNGSLETNKDLVDEIDDNSIVTAMMNQQQWQREAKASRSFRGRSQKALERETDTTSNNSSSSSMSSQLTATRNLPSTAAVELQSFLRRRHKCTASKNFGPRNAQASLRAEIVNDLIGSKDENKFLARFRLTTNFLGNRIDVGRMYLWHQRQTTRAYANILGRSIWDTSQGCKDKAPHQMLYMPLFDFNLWLVKVSVGLRLSAEMGFFSNCQGAEDAFTMKPDLTAHNSSGFNGTASSRLSARSATSDDLQLFPTVSLRAAGEATAKLVVARAGMSVASHYGYQGSISVSRQPDSCMSIYSAHQPMNVTFSSWFQLWDNDCHFWGSRSRAEPQAIKWRLMARKPMIWLEDECLTIAPNNSTTNESAKYRSGSEKEKSLGSNSKKDL